MTSPNTNPLPLYRRPSYATVVAGRSSSAYHFNTLGAASAQTSTSSLPSPLPQHHQHSPSRQRSRSSLRSMEIDGQGGNTAAWNSNHKRHASANWAEDFSGRVGAEGGRMGCTVHEEHAPFFTPSYLRCSRHVVRLKKGYEEHLAELRERAQMGLANPPPSTTAAARPGSSLSASSSHINLGKMHHHRAPPPIQDIIERLPPLSTSSSETDHTHPLPSRWTDPDPTPGLELLADSTEVRFTGIGKQHPGDDAIAVRADHAMPREVGLYYFEVTVLSRGKDGPIGIGFSGKKVNLSRLPGWEADSWAYHGDDGYSFACTASGKAYGPRYSSQDVVGCGVNFRTGTGFFTRNGVFLGNAFTNLPKAEPLYPSVGIKKPGEHIRVNFGRHPFVFDIDAMMAEERALIRAELESADVSALHPPDDERALIHGLITQYLVHEGYVGTAKAFHADVREQTRAHVQGRDGGEGEEDEDEDDEEEDVHALNRQKIRRAILDGDVDLALKFLGAFYPRVLEEERNRDVVFRLKCRKFVEMIRRCYEVSSGVGGEGNGHAGEDGEGEEEGEDDDDDDDDDHAGVNSTQMELDDQLHRESQPAAPNPTNGAPAPASTPDDIDMDASTPSLLPRPTTSSATRRKSSLMLHQTLLNQTLAYGQQLKAEYISDARPAVQKELENCFALLAYPDPVASVVGGLLDPRGRADVAEGVGSAVLVSLGKPPSAALEKVCAQAEAMLEEVAARTGGGAAFVDVRGDFLTG